jgi:hypothetical protein
LLFVFLLMQFAWCLYLTCFSVFNHNPIFLCFSRYTVVCLACINHHSCTFVHFVHFVWPWSFDPIILRTLNSSQAVTEYHSFLSSEHSNVDSTMWNSNTMCRSYIVQKYSICLTPIKLRFLHNIYKSFNIYTYFRKWWKDDILHGDHRNPLSVCRRSLMI